MEGSQICAPIIHKNVIQHLNKIENDTWFNFEAVRKNYKASNYWYNQIVRRMLKSYEKLECLMTLKVHFVHFHLIKFPRMKRTHPGQRDCVTAK